MNLRERALLVALRIESWTGMKVDPGVSEEVERQHDAEADSGRYSKRLIDKGALKPIQRLDSRARTILYHYSHPWDNNGRRIVPTRLWETLSQKLQEVYNERQDAIASFIEAYPAEIRKSQARLGSMYDPNDYPRADSLNYLFKFKLSYEPLPDSNDFRVDLSEDQVSLIKQEAEAEYRQYINDTSRYNIDRLHKAVKRIAVRLGESENGKNLHKSMITDVHELVKLLPALNITNDDKLEKLCLDVQEAFAHLDINDLRNDPLVRKNTKYDAEKLTKKLEGVF